MCCYVNGSQQRSLSALGRFTEVCLVVHIVSGLVWFISRSTVSWLTSSFYLLLAAFK